MIKFNSENHTYQKENGEPLVSVSALLREVFPAEFCLSGVNPEILKKSADYGTVIHSEIQDWLEAGVDTISIELENFKNWWVEKGLKLIDCEQIISTDVYAGRYDIRAKDSAGKTYLIDIKTTSSKLKSKWQKQLSLYNYKTQCDYMLVAWLKNDKIEIVELEYLGDGFAKECEKAYTEMRNFKDNSSLITLEKNEVSLLSEMFAIKKRAEDFIENFNASLKEQMKKHGVKSYDFGEFKAVLVEPTQRASIDTTLLKKELPDVAEKYKKISNVSESLRITTKGIKE